MFMTLCIIVIVFCFLCEVFDTDFIGEKAAKKMADEMADREDDE